MQHRSTVVPRLFAGAVSLMAASISVKAIPLLSDFTTAYTQDFNTLPMSGTGSILPTGWAFIESGTGANATYSAGTGSSTGGDVYSFGATGSADRSLGGLQTGSLIPTFGVQLSNGTGQEINSLMVSFTGEQWRLGTLGRTDRLDFQYSLDASSLTTGNWTDLDSLDFVSPTMAGTVGALNGDLAGNQQALSGLIDGFTLNSDSVIWFRWTDFNATSSDDGLAIDDFSVQAIITSPTSVPDGGPTLALLGFSFLGIVWLKRPLGARHSSSAWYSDGSQ
jgi:uncharacterized protein